MPADRKLKFDKPLAEMTQEELTEIYGDFNTKVPINVDRHGRITVDIEAQLNHPRARFNRDFVEENWDKLKEALRP